MIPPPAGIANSDRRNAARAINLRPELADHLRQRTQAFGEGFQRNLALVGLPGAGKTFQLQSLLAQPVAGLTYLYCAVYRESCRSFLQRLLCAILHSALPVPADVNPAQVNGSPDRALDALLEHATTELPRTAAAIAAVEPLLARRLYGEAFSRALDVIPVLMEERRQPVVVILDEFLFLEELGLVHAFHELGKRVMTWNSVLFILASSAPYRAQAILRERLQLLFGQFELLTLEAIDVKSAAAWVQQELRGLRGGKTFTPFLIQWLSAYPWYLALFLKRVKELALMARAPEVTDALFCAAAWDLIGSPEGALHQWCASRMERLAPPRVGARALEVLMQVADQTRTTTDLGRRIGRSGLSGALQLLVEHDLAQRNGMCWMVTDPVLRCWLSTIMGVQRSNARPDTSDIKPRFEQYLRTLWTQWVQTHGLSFQEQVANLFAQFCDDTVSLDAKTGRLPKFHRITTHQPEGSPGVYLVADGEGKRWCVSVQEGAVDEGAVAQFDAFCRSQLPKPGRKVVITRVSMDEHAKVLAKAASMWVWEPEDIELLKGLYGRI